MQGTLDLLVLRTLSTGGTMHGYAITERVLQVSRDVLRIEAGSLYPALHRMEESGWVRSAWDVSDNNRRARFYTLTTAGGSVSPRKRNIGRVSPMPSGGC